ncbi:alpha-N-arabinofuranosidase [Botrimarina mediterranea]|uniref:non-reducing end alpha-L-arabinofuranosidase n=1 Tax=Botrimarina mediterranea TaxID=2528022 RepID=A0A518K7Y6_9BACT|nr:alpha-L-arabinofuranosidase C-terminal domain-containing protein [Botrimarina mediterranea]QDV73895.1 Intracellular exo-alpha-L-arabinofuranosidase 2 [Botrimarina mediterranea]QDV78525.1 Intracellular exo-alpha-L-arabinofuranosidase 2 [Planctomycetes bacterium K2D]
MRSLLTLLLFVAGIARGEQVACTIHATEDGGKISRHLYGHFAEHLGRCVYDGIWVGEDSDIPNKNGVRTDIIDALKAIKIPNLRWPGGCFADDYHWRDGIGPVEERPKRINIHWGQEVETNAFGTHEFLNLCEELGAEPYLAGNVGSGTPQELRDWVEYITYDGDSELANLRRSHGREKPWKLKYLGVGNENWGCGGDMRPEYYADLYRRYAMFCRDFSGNELYRVACGPSGFDKNWNQVVMQRAHRQMQGYSLHYYTLAAPWSDKRPATGFDEEAWFSILRDSLQMRRAIHEAEDAMDPVDPDKRIGLIVDEWGTWYRGEPGTPGYALYQQNTLRDALVAGLTLHIFHENNERVVMANLAQTVNVLQALILTDGPKMALTPTYHVLDLFKVHHDAKRLPVDVGAVDYKYRDQKIPAISVSASTKEAGVIDVSIVNTHAREAVSVSFDLDGATAKEVTSKVLNAEELDAHNTFDEPGRLQPKAFDGARIVDGDVKVDMPPRSIVVIALRLD